MLIYLTHDLERRPQTSVVGSGEVGARLWGVDEGVTQSQQDIGDDGSGQDQPTELNATPEDVDFPTTEEEEEEAIRNFLSSWSMPTGPKEYPKHLGWEGDDSQPTGQGPKADALGPTHHTESPSEKRQISRFQGAVDGHGCHQHAPPDGDEAESPTTTEMMQNSSEEGVFTPHPSWRGPSNYVAQPILDEFPSSKIATSAVRSTDEEKIRPNTRFSLVLPRPSHEFPSSKIATSAVRSTDEEKIRPNTRFSLVLPRPSHEFPSSRIEARSTSSPGVFAARPLCGEISPSQIVATTRASGHFECAPQWVYAVGNIPKKGSDEDSDEESEPFYAILDGGAVDNMFNVAEECFKTYKKCNASWGTAKRNNLLRAAGEGKIVIRVVDTRNKAYAIELHAYHVPQLAMNLLSVYYLCKRGYVVEHDLPFTTIRQKGSSNPIFRCPVRGRLWAMSFKTKIQPQEEFVFLSVDVPPMIMKLHEKHGHASLAKLKRMAIIGELDDESKEVRVHLNLLKGDITCAACDAGIRARRRGEILKKRGKGKEDYQP